MAENEALKDKLAAKSQSWWRQSWSWLSSKQLNADLVDMLETKAHELGTKTQELEAKTLELEAKTWEFDIVQQKNRGKMRKFDVWNEVRLDL